MSKEDLTLWSYGHRCSCYQIHYAVKPGQCATSTANIYTAATNTTIDI